MAPSSVNLAEEMNEQACPCLSIPVCSATSWCYSCVEQSPRPQPVPPPPGSFPCACLRFEPICTLAAALLQLSQQDAQHSDLLVACTPVQPEIGGCVIGRSVPHREPGARLVSGMKETAKVSWERTNTRRTAFPRGPSGHRLSRQLSSCSDLRGWQVSPTQLSSYRVTQGSSGDLGPSGSPVPRRHRSMSGGP